MLSVALKSAWCVCAISSISLIYTQDFCSLSVFRFIQSSGSPAGSVLSISALFLSWLCQYFIHCLVCLVCYVVCFHALQVFMFLPCFFPSCLGCLPHKNYTASRCFWDTHGPRNQTVRPSVVSEKVIPSTTTVPDTSCHMKHRQQIAQILEPWTSTISGYVCPFALFRPIPSAFCDVFIPASWSSWMRLRDSPIL